jgi:hypothetical protein
VNKKYGSQFKQSINGEGTQNVGRASRKSDSKMSKMSPKTTQLPKYTLLS